MHVAESDQFATQKNSGIAATTLTTLLRLFEQTTGLDRVWLFGSRARGDFRNESDIDLVVDSPSLDSRDFARLSGDLDELGLMYRVDLVNWNDKLEDRFRSLIQKDRKIFWEPRRHPAQAPALAGTQLKEFQTKVLEQLGQFVTELKTHQAQAEPIVQALRAMESAHDLLREASDFPKKTWNALKSQGLLPPAFAGQPYSSRFDGADRAIPNVCLKVPTGGGKTLLAAASVGRVFSSYLNRHTGLVLWIVPNEAIYRQTLKTLANRDHPYRQMLNTAGAGRVKILEKTRHSPGSMSTAICA